jgi:REP-associated tyrosine transposase
MPRMARIVAPLHPHHVTQRGNRRQKTFFGAYDYRRYLTLLKQASVKSACSVWAYCLMPNHVHLVLVPEHVDSLAKLFREAHLKYTLHINSREGWRGHLWQERFHSYVMDEKHLFATVRYIELNPVRAGLCETPQDWPWSSVHAHLERNDDGLVEVAPMLMRVGNWEEYLLHENDKQILKNIRSCSRTGRPGGDDEFVGRIEDITGRNIRKRRSGRKRVQSHALN